MAILVLDKFEDKAGFIIQKTKTIGKSALRERHTDKIQWS